MRFAIQTPAATEFGPGAARLAPEAAARLGRRVLLVTGRTPERHAWLSGALAARGLLAETLVVPAEPDLPALLDAVSLGRIAGIDAVVAIGGGSALDMGKAVAGLAPSPAPALDHLEVVGQSLPLGVAPLPVIAIPTTAGSGSEATRNAVIGLPEHGRKVSLRDPRLLPRLALVDPDLMQGAPWPVALASGLDAIAQVVEPFVSPFATPFTDALCREAIPRGLGAIRRLREGDRTAWPDMAWVALSGGLALANGRLGAVHGLAGVIGGRIAAPHGAICGRLLPAVLEANAAAAGGPRLAAVLAMLGEAFGVPPGRAIGALRDWIDAAGLPDLRDMGLDPASHGAIAEASLAASSMRGNPVALPVATLRAILAAS